MKEEPARIGRPREFDIDAALDAALTVFWRHGYEGASLSDLTAAMRINRPSLYAAFGSKEELFRRAMQRYAQRAAATLQACQAEPTAKGFVQCMLRTACHSSAGSRKPAGCFLIQSMSACSASAEPLRREAMAHRVAVQEMLQARLEQATRAGELPPKANPAVLASFYATVMAGISLQAASGACGDMLIQIADVAMQAWPDALTLTPHAHRSARKAEPARSRSARG